MDNTERQAQQRQSILEVLRDDLEEHVNQSIDAASGTAETETVGQALASATDNFAGACEVIGLSGLAHYCNWIHGQLTGRGSDPEIVALAGAWAMPALNYIQALLDDDDLTDASDELIAYLADEFWASEPPDEPPLRQALQNPAIQIEEEPDDEWPETAEPAMLSVALPDTVNHSLLEGFLTELPEQLEQMTQLVEQAGGQAGNLSLDALHRIAHTIKGSANVVGIAGMANLMHLCEDLLDELRAGRLEPDATIAGLLGESADTLGSLLDHLSDGTRPGEAECRTLQKLLDIRHGRTIEIDTTPAATTETREHSASDKVAPTSAAETVRIDPQHLQQGLDITGELAIGHTMAQRYTQDNLETVRQARGLSDNLYALTRDFARLLGSGQLTGVSHQSDGPLDRLEFEQYNEFHSLYSRLEELQRDVGDHLDLIQSASLAQRDAAQRHNALLRDLQNHLQHMLGVPFNRLAPRLQRCVRQTARMTGKTAELTLHGDQTLVDSHLLQQLTDPLMHLLRNAVDHGIEPAQERTGKPEAGQIALSLSRNEHQLHIELRDDGRGLDRERIVQIARQRGLIKPDEPQTTAENLILMPGFSTREQASQTSGRGVGLDVVAEAVRRLGGQMHVDSHSGEGCSFTLTLPLNLVTDHHLVVRLAGRDLALNTQCIEQLVFHESDAALPTGGEPLYTELLQEPLPAYDLAELLGEPQAHRHPPEQRSHALLLINTGRERFLVRTPSVSASRELVVKRAPPHTPDLTGIHSYTVLEDGSVAPIVQLEAFIAAARSGQNRPAPRPASGERTPSQRPARVLIVDDSLSARRSLAQFVEDMGLKADTAKDGLEAIARLQQAQPALVLADMEMPRMNGLELTEHIRANSATRTLPVVMVTSRSTQKHRTLAERAGVDRYLNKPYSDDELTNAIRDGLDGHKKWKNTA